jgi:hypothetical protein
MKLTRSNYEWMIKEGILCIVDQNLGGTSVTNDMENILTEIYLYSDNSIKKMGIIYRDSEGVWDGVHSKWDQRKCENVSFYPIGERELEIAITKMKEI